MIVTLEVEQKKDISYESSMKSRPSGPQVSDDYSDSNMFNYKSMPRDKMKSVLERPNETIPLES